MTDAILFDVPSLMNPADRNPKIVMLAEHQEVDNFDFDETNQITVKEKNVFLKEISNSLEEHVKLDNTVNKVHVFEVLNEVKTKVLKVMQDTGKATTMRNRRLSISSKRSLEDSSGRTTKQKLQPSSLASAQTQF